MRSPETSLLPAASFIARERALYAKDLHRGGGALAYLSLLQTKSVHIYGGFINPFEWAAHTWRRARSSPPSRNISSAQSAAPSAPRSAAYSAVLEESVHLTCRVDFHASFANARGLRWGARLLVVGCARKSVKASAWHNGRI